MSRTTLQSLLAEARAALEASGADAPALSSRVLAGHALSLSPEAMAREPDLAVPESDAERLRALVRRRVDGEPVATILGVKEFYGLDFRVCPDVLTPRPETEHLVEQAVELFPSDAPLRFADLGTGSGCLAVTLCTLFPDARGVALDRSAPALAVARGNAEAHGAADRLEFVQGDFAAPCAPEGSLDLVVANPPYVSAAEYAGLAREVREHEPRAALVPESGHDAAPGHQGTTGLEDSSATGLEALAALAPAALAMLRPGGVMLCEFGCTQGPAVAGLLRDAGFVEVVVGRDLAGLDRWSRARRP